MRPMLVLLTIVSVFDSCQRFPTSRDCTGPVTRAQVHYLQSRSIPGAPWRGLMGRI
jgi:hypothetical protein